MLPSQKNNLKHDTCMAIDKKRKAWQEIWICTFSVNFFTAIKRHKDAIGKKGAYTGFSFPNLKFTTKIWNDYEIFGYD